MPYLRARLDGKVLGSGFYAFVERRGKKRKQKKEGRRKEEEREMQRGEEHRLLPCRLSAVSNCSFSSI